MNIYLIRHGDSEKSSAAKKDSERELTSAGKTITRNAASAWKKIIPSFDYIITSPYTRAVQTAEIIAEVFGYTDEIIKDKKLSPGSRTGDLIELAQSYNAGSIAFVGHQPDFSEHLANLVSVSGAFAEFKKSGIAGINFGNKVKMGKGTLLFLIPPDLL